MPRHGNLAAFAAGAAMALAGLPAAGVAAGTVSAGDVKGDGAMPMPTFELPWSSFASPEARDYVVRQFHMPPAELADLQARRREVDARFYAPKIERLARLYPYHSTKSRIGGVPVETFVPDAGVAPENRNRVLVNLHGGGFVFGGGGPGGAAESIEIATLARIRVVSVDYRMAPEYRFPAGSEDVAAVYRELLETYRPENIGIYGCSAGGVLAAESIGWFRKEGLPKPGAIGIFCASTHRSGEGDSAQIWPRMQSVGQTAPGPLDPETFGPTQPYFAGASPKDPLVVPAASPELLKSFPPTLFITSSRAPEMSAAVQSHLELVELGVKSQLLVFDGLEHGFVVYPIPEATRAYRIAAKFFMENLGSEPRKP
jgi:acetyl esterase/lipase